MLSESTVRDIRERTDLVALIGEAVALKRHGASYRGLCPFHSERSPSFYVHPGRGFFHCFGCKASGDALAFVMRQDGSTFPEAARRLAERAGVAIETTTGGEQSERHQADQRKQRWYQLMETALGFYVAQLGMPGGAAARAELDARGIDGDITTRFRLGYAPDGWDGLSRYLTERGHSLSDAETLGLVVPRKTGSGTYDRFRHRLMFAVTDVQGRPIAFSGRALLGAATEGAQGEPPAKYINSPETPLYQKGGVLFGLYEARVAARQQNTLVVCEGNFDVLALHQAGVTHAAAPLGTAFTERHVALIKRFSERVVLLFDGDAAGRRAIAAAFLLLQDSGLDVRVVPLPEKADPDTFRRERGDEALRTLVGSSVNIITFLIDEAATRSGGDPTRKAQEIQALGPILARVSNPVERPLYLQRIAQRFELSDLRSVREQLARGHRMGQKPAPQVNSTTSHAPSLARDVRPAPLRGRMPSVEAELVGALLDQPQLLAEFDAVQLEELLTNQPLKAILRGLVTCYTAGPRFDASLLLAQLEEHAAAQQWVGHRLAVETYDETQARELIQREVPRLRRQEIERVLPGLATRIVEAYRVGDDQLAADLTRQRMQLEQTALRTHETLAELKRS